MRYSCRMANSDSEGELPIVKHAREAAKDALRFIPKEAWEAVRQVRGMRDQILQAGESVGKQLQEANER